uniref:Uncharacterized protein n=1 Tax=viral metagenome TaxID=1070528 RepID=A0A6C0CKY9_9ZZZZ
MRNLIVHREVKGFNDGPYRFESARIYVGNQTVDIGPDDGKDTVILVDAPVESLSARLCALDRNDLNRCYFTVEMWGPLRTDDAGDAHVEFWVQGPCICFQLVAI